MSIESTYGGQWSSDPALLKSLLDAGETVIVQSTPIMTAYKDADGYYHYMIFRFSEANWDNQIYKFHEGYVKFLVPSPHPAVEPKPLEWKHLEMNEEAMAVQGQWSFTAWDDGGWLVQYDGNVLVDNIDRDCGDFDTAKAEIHEWRVKHLKSMIQ